MNQSPSVDPSHFLRSFLVVAFHYVVLYAGLLMGMLLIARLRFPKVFQLWALEEIDLDEFRDTWENNPAILFPDELCVWMLVLSIVLSAFIGLQVAFWAPFARAGHGIFLAIICICTYLQISITQPEIPKWMMVGMLILSPTMIVIASSYGDRWFGRSNTSAEADAVEDTSSDQEPGDDADELAH